MIDNVSLERANLVASIYNTEAITDNTVDSYANLLYPYILDNGGNDNSVSLTIDIMNYQELENKTLNAPNKKWVNHRRMQNGLSFAKDIWGFKQAFHGNKKSHAISNAFCFDGQDLTFYIAPQGHGVGQIDDKWVYSKLSIVVLITDLVSGEDTVLKTFDNFNVDAKDSTRYFNWTVPSKSDDLFSDYGLFGMHVIKIDIERTYYKDAEATILFPEYAPYKNQAYLQLLVYSGVKEIAEVDGGDISVLTTPPLLLLPTDTLENIYAKTIFEELDDTNLNGLTSANKRAVIADQIAVLFMTQHPVLNADSYPSKIIGGGGQASVQPSKIIKKAITYSLKYPEIISMVEDRLYGMFVNYNIFNFTEEMTEVIPDVSQSSQVIRDPVRGVLINSNGIVSGDMGINGVIFNPYAVNITNAEFLSYVPQSVVFDCLLSEVNIDIQNITITNWDNEEIQPSDDQVMIAFDVSFGAEQIKEVRYSVFSLGSLNYATFIDITGDTRSYQFTLGNPVVPEPTSNGDVITAQIDIEDIDGNLSSFVRTVFTQGNEEAPALTNLNIYQRIEGDRVADLYYTYEGLSEINDSYLYVQFSIDNGLTWSNIPTTSLRGDYGSNVKPGRRRVTWALEDNLSNVSTTGIVMCRLILYDMDNKQATGDNLTGALIWDLVDPEVAIMRVNLKVN